MDQSRFDEAVNEVRVIGSELRRLAKAFRDIGNEHLFAELDEYSRELFACAREFAEYDCSVSAERLKDAQQATANMMGAVLAVARTKCEQ